MVEDTNMGRPEGINPSPVNSGYESGEITAVEERSPRKPRVNFRTENGELLAVMAGRTELTNPAEILDAVERFLSTQAGKFEADETEEVSFLDSRDVRNAWRNVNQLENTLSMLATYLDGLSEGASSELEVRFEAVIEKARELMIKCAETKEKLNRAQEKLEDAAREAKFRSMSRLSRAAWTAAARAFPVIALSIGLGVAGTQDASAQRSSQPPMNNPPSFVNDLNGFNQSEIRGEQSFQDIDVSNLLSSMNSVEEYLGSIERALNTILGKEDVALIDDDDREPSLEGGEPDSEDAELVNHPVAEMVSNLGSTINGLESTFGNLGFTTDKEAQFQGVEVGLDFDAPVFTLTSEMGDAIGGVIGKEVPQAGIAISLSDEFLAGSLETLFAGAPELRSHIQALQGKIASFRTLGGDGIIDLIVQPKQDGTFKASAIIRITAPFSEGDVQFNEGALWAGSENFINDTDRSSLGIDTDPVAKFVTPKLANSVPVTLPPDGMVLLEVTANQKAITIRTKDGVKLLIDHVAQGEQAVNLRSEASTNSAILATVDRYVLEIGSEENYLEKTTGNYPLQTEPTGNGVHFGVDGIIMYRDANGGEWVAAKVVETDGVNRPGWVSTTVVELETTVTPEAAATPSDLQEKATAVPASTEDPNLETDTDLPAATETPNPDVDTIFGYSTPEAVQQRQYDQALEGFVRVENEKTFVYRENIGQDMEVTDTLPSQYGTLTLERPTNSPYGNGEEERSMEFTSHMKLNGEPGIRQFYIELIKKAFEINEDEALAMLENDTPIPLHILKDSIDFANSGRMNGNNSETVFVRPSSGMTITFIENLPHPLGPENKPFNNTFANLALSPNPDGSDNSIINFGYSVYVNESGRIFLLVGTQNPTPEDAGFNSLFIYGLDHVIRSAGRQGSSLSAIKTPPHQSGFYKVFGPTENVTIAFGLPFNESSRSLTREEWMARTLVATKIQN